MAIIVIMVSGFLDIPLDGPLDYQEVLAKKEGEWGKEKSYCWGRGGLREQGREENFQKTGRRRARKKEREQQKGRRENVVAKDRKTRETNPSGSFQTLLSLLTRSLFSSPHLPLRSRPRVEWTFTVQLCFPSKRSMNVKFSKKKRKKERKRTPSYAVLSLPFSNPTHSLSSCLHFPVFPYVCPFFSAPSLSHSQYRTKLITSFQQRQKRPGTQPRGPPVAACRLFSMAA